MEHHRYMGAGRGRGRGLMQAECMKEITSVGVYFK